MDKEQREFDAWWKTHVASGKAKSNYELAREAFRAGWDAGEWHDTDELVHPRAVG